MLLQAGRKISQAREQRLLNVVAPLVAKGCNLVEIAEVVGYSRSMAGHDVELVRRMWEEAAAETSDRCPGTDLGPGS